MRICRRPPRVPFSPDLASPAMCGTGRGGGMGRERVRATEWSRRLAGEREIGGVDGSRWMCRKEMDGSRRVRWRIGRPDARTVALPINFLSPSLSQISRVRDRSASVAPPAGATGRGLGLRTPAAPPDHGCRRGRRPLGASPRRCPARPLPRTSSEKKGHRERAVGERGGERKGPTRPTTEAGRSSWWWSEEEQKPRASSASPASRELAGPPKPLGHPPPAPTKIRAGEGGPAGSIQPSTGTK
ncbi:unnamed protein product [Urochloa humidicola]